MQKTERRVKYLKHFRSQVPQGDPLPEHLSAEMDALLLDQEGVMHLHYASSDDSDGGLNLTRFTAASQPWRSEAADRRLRALDAAIYDVLKVLPAAQRPRPVDHNESSKVSSSISPKLGTFLHGNSDLAWAFHPLTLQSLITNVSGAHGQLLYPNWSPSDQVPGAMRTGSDKVGSEGAHATRLSE